MMKRSILAILTLLVMLLSAAAVADEQISFEENTVSIFENEKYLLVPILSDGLQGGTVTYKSGDNRIVVVNADGELTGVSKGNTTVTASLKTAKKTYKATVKVSVKRPVTGIELNEDALNILSAEDGISFILAQSLLGDALPEAHLVFGNIGRRKFSFGVAKIDRKHSGPASEVKDFLTRSAYSKVNQLFVHAFGIDVAVFCIFAGGSSKIKIISLINKT